MNKYENKLALSVLATLISGIALIYTLIIYHHIIFAVMGVSLLFLICAYVLTQNIIAFTLEKNKKMNKQLREYINDISEQLENMSETQTRLGKATFLYTKKAAKTVDTLENNYTESQDALFKNLSSIAVTQSKATKLIIKCDQANTTKLISTIRELRSQLSDTLVQGLDQIQPDNAEVIEALEYIVNYLKAQPAVPDRTLSLQLNDIAQELQNISNNLQHFQTPVQNIIPETKESISETLNNSLPGDDITAMSDKAPIAEAIVAEEVVNTEPIIEETIIEEAANTEPIIGEAIIGEDSITEAIDDEIVTEASNKQLSADEIAALFAAAEPSLQKETAGEEQQIFTPTFTVVGKSDEYVNEEEIKASNDFDDDLNKPLSADEIAALFAATDPAPKKTKKTVSDTPAPEFSEDSTKALSADEIAALFAAAEPTP